ncbi:DUF1549 domain-containing protein [Singulisphaera sp. PoT]|uniref:DUF1549 domain-containing protein n=1 Tax=Singulisphaera sp. PoT TaxID=3411797 RepID=UPI003BF5129A
MRSPHAANSRTVLSSLWLIGMASLALLGANAPSSTVKNSTAVLSQPPSSLRPLPAKLVLRGPDAVQQLAVDRVEADGNTHDVTTNTKFKSTDPKVATVDASGVVVAKGDGSTSIVIDQGGTTSEVSVVVKDFASGLPVNFANQVVPVFTKLGCNSGGCHGKASGQNGFRLSLLGFEPNLDYETLVNEGRGRRLFPAVPEQSLLLLKGTAKMPHGGGRKLEANSHEYQVILRWIAQGMPMGKPTDPALASIEIFPNSRVMPRGAKQQVVVTARYSDGSTEDVTRWAQYQSNDVEIASVAEGGLVETLNLAGQVAVMARYQGQVAVYNAIVPLGKKLDSASYNFSSTNLVDVAVRKQWEALGIVPSEPCSDAEFIRRASLDVIGTLPTAAEVKGFVADADPNKRDKLVDKLLERPEYASFFAIKWADILRNKREGNPKAQRGTYTFYDWIRENLSKNVPYDKFVRGILAASGTPETSPPVQWYRRIKGADAFVDDTAQVFLGMRLQCAKCHHHPFEKWSQNDYYGFAAFFARVGRKPSMNAQRAGRDDEVIFTARSGAVAHPKTGQVMTPKGLGGEVFKISIRNDPRQKLVDWMADPKNPFFAKALVNRYWAHFFGRGVAEPLDDLRETNPPSNPELLETLSADFIKSGYDLKHLVRTITTSKVYGLSSVPNEFNLKDKQSFARHYPKRMSAEVLLDAVSQLSGVPTDFSGLPQGTRAIELPDESVGSTFLDTFGRPKRDTPCECERVTDASLGQSLMLINSGEIQTKLAAAGSRAEALAKDARPEVEKVDELFWTAYARTPSSGESATALAHLAAHPDQKRQAYEDLIWALMNAKEFQFND